MRPRQQSCRWNFMPPKIHRALECSALEFLEIGHTNIYQLCLARPSTATASFLGFVWLCDQAKSVHLHAISQDLNSERTWTKDRIRIERSAKEPAKWPQVTKWFFGSKYLVIHEIMKFAPNISKICTVSWSAMDVSVPSVQRNVLPHEIMLHQPWLQDIPRLVGIIPSLGTHDGTWIFLCLELRSWHT